MELIELAADESFPYPLIPEYDSETESCRRCGATVAHFSERHPVTERSVLIPGPAWENTDDGTAHGICACLTPPQLAALG
jgi:hypothetical protein